MDWTIKTASTETKVSSLDELRDAIKALPLGTQYQITINGPSQPVPVTTPDGRQLSVVLPGNFSGRR